MTGWAEEAEAGAELVNEAGAKLYARDPKHPLLKYLYSQPEDLGADGKPDPEKEKAVQVEMKDRFWRGPKPWQNCAGAVVVATVYARYYIALQRALDGKEGDFEPEPPKKPRRR